MANEQPIFIHLQNKPEITHDGKIKDRRTLDAFCFMLNTFAMGDVIAAVPVIKYMIDNFYTTPESYKVCLKLCFRDLFPFVPDENIIDFDKKDNFWGIPPTMAVGTLNRKNEPRLVRTTPKSIHLSTYASLVFADRIIPLEELNYVDIPTSPEVNIALDRFGIDFAKSVILVSSYRDETRMWRTESMLATALWIKEKGFIPVFVGKTDMDLSLPDAQRPKSALPNDLTKYGVDLRNKTSLLDLVAIFKRARAVCGVDSGPIHLAGTTSVPIICGYTSVAPEIRIPTRKEGKTYALTADIPCISCESRWRSNYWNFENCYFQHAECSKQLTADRFIRVLNQIL